jgi:hypothetical protein
MPGSHGPAWSRILPSSPQPRSQPPGSALNASTLLWGVLFGSIGFGFFLYGRKQRAVVPLACGLALMLFPYFVSGTLPLLAIGIALMAIPYFVKV